jgi:hypothetical protein|nr:MAG TPA: hypothetical protein [Caudoviricetes sp.]
MGKTLQEIEEITNKALTEYFGRKEPPVVLAYVCGSRAVKTYIDIRQRPYILKITEDVLAKKCIVQIANINGEIINNE